MTDKALSFLKGLLALLIALLWLWPILVGLVDLLCWAWLLHTCTGYHWNESSRQMLAFWWVVIPFLFLMLCAGSV